MKSLTAATASEVKAGLETNLPSGESSSYDRTAPEGGDGAEPEQGAISARDDADNESIGGQRNVMSKKRLLVAIPALSVCLFVSFLDQTSVSTATPAVAEDLNTGAATSWIGTSFLVASTAFQLINGRLSDIFGRKKLLLGSLALMAIGDLACGFSRTPAELFFFRSIAGIGGGGINSLVIIIVSDITTMENRGKYQGILGAVIALANGVGPFLGGVIASTSTWRWVFWIIPIVAIPTGVIIWFLLPLQHRSGNYEDKIRKIDYGGVLLNIASTLLVLVPLSGAGITYAWRSPFVISSLTIGISLAALFVLYEWKIAKLPIMPLRLYKSRQCSALYMQSFLTGIAYFGNFFYLPIYFQAILQYSALTSGALILPLIISTSATSIIAGQSMSRIGRYMPCILVGFALWTIGAGLTLLFNRTTSIRDIIGYLIVEGSGIGLTLQPTLVGMYANSRSEDRAVTTGLRNFIRTIGGAFGLVISGVVLSNTLNRELAGASFVTGNVITALTSSTLAIDKMGFSPQEKNKILDAYMMGIHYIFIFYSLCSGLSLLLTLLVGNTSLRSPQPRIQETNNKGRHQDLASPVANIEISSDKAAGC